MGLKSVKHLKRRKKCFPPGTDGKGDFIRPFQHGLSMLWAGVGHPDAAHPDGMVP